MTAYIICLIVGYFCGCISMGYFVGRFYHMDIRTKGSGNAGTTNVLRNLGKIPALITFAGDLAKAIIPILVIRLVFAPEQWYLWCLYCGLGVVLGHNYPFYLGFKGGKGILCSGTLLLLLDWRIAAVGWGLFALLWLTTRYVSLGSVSGAVSFPVTTLIFCPGNWTVFVLSLLIAALVIWAHRENISRLLHGTESRFRWHTDAP